MMGYIKDIVNKCIEKSNERQLFIDELLEACRDGYVEITKEKHFNSHVLRVYIKVNDHMQSIGKYCPSTGGSEIRFVGFEYVDDEILTDQFLDHNDRSFSISYDTLVNNGAKCKLQIERDASYKE